MDTLFNHKLFEVIKGSLPSEYCNGVNIIEYRNGILYAWNCIDCTILTLNVEFQVKHSKEYPMQILRLTNPPIFEVNRLLINKSNTYCAIIGSKGVAVIRIPRRWGSEGIFEGGKLDIACKCVVLDERYFECKSIKIVQQVRWHPASSDLIHLIVLTTENTLRLYDVQKQILVTVWYPERAFFSSSMRESSCGRGMQTLASLGETAIDFDFTPPVIVGNANSNKCEVEWPMLILRGNGDVYVLTASLENKKKVKIDGPLPVYPTADDNYGMEDASSLIVLKTAPPLVVISTCSGNVYHSMLLSFDENEESDESIEIDSSQPYHSNSGLYIFECIKLELGISLDESAELYSSPINLLADPYNSSRYFCLHEAGLHAVILSLVSDLDKYAKCSDDDADQYLPSLRHNQSIVEYLICTRINAEEPSEEHSSPLIGFRITELPCYLITLSITGEFIALPLAPTTFMLESTASLPAATGDENEFQFENFDVHIQNILKPENGSSRPILKLDPNISHSSETYAEILNQEIEGLKEEYFGKYHTSVKEIERRIKLLKILKEKQLDEINETEKKIDEIEQKRQVLKELSQKVKEKQDLFETRVKGILQNVKKIQPGNSVSQKRLLEKLRKYNITVQNLRTRVDDLHKKQQYQENKFQEENTELYRNNLYLNEDHQKIIANNLQRMGDSILKLKKTHQNMKKITETLLENIEN